MIKFFKKYHKWISIIFTLLIIMFSFSGIILNHRDALSGIDVNRKLLPSGYHYQNWNNAAVKSTLKINNDSILIYGNIGIWLTNSIQNSFIDLNTGFPKGIDNRKISKVLLSKSNKLYAGTLFGLYNFSYNESKWKYVKLPIHEKKIVDIIQKEDTVLILTRSHLIKTSDFRRFEIITLPVPEGYDNKVSLFKTLWIIHSGEIYGTTGKFIVDIIGLIFAFLTITGLIIFFNRIKVKSKSTSTHKKVRKLRINKSLLRWHNKTGWITILFLLITASTGIFLRPPFLIPIADVKVSKLPLSELDTENPWFDQLRRILYDSAKNRFIVATSEALYYSDDNLSSSINKFKYQPPISIMGVNVFRKKSDNTYLIGSFEGLYEWNSETGYTFDYIKKGKYNKPKGKSRPLGEYLVTGYSDDFPDTEIYFEYNNGANKIKGIPLTTMPDKISEQPISLWNTALEIHTGRIFQNLIGDFYILIVPITGLALLFILISGFFLWLKLYRRKRHKMKI